jgi:hypothetical protein
MGASAPDLDDRVSLRGLVARSLAVMEAHLEQVAPCDP